MVLASLDDTHGLTQSLPDTIALERWSWEKVGGHSPEQETCSHQGGNANMMPAHLTVRNDPSGWFVTSPPASP